MALSLIKNQTKQNDFNDLKKKINSESDSVVHQDVEKVSKKTNSYYIPPTKPKNEQNKTTTIERIKPNQNSLSEKQRQENDKINKEVLEKSRVQQNPLLPILTEMSHTLLGLDKILSDILKTLQSMGSNLDSNLEDSGLNFDDWGKRKERKTKKERKTNKRGSKRERGQRRPGIRRPGIKRGAIGGLLGLGTILGLSSLIDEDSRDNNEDSKNSSILDTASDISNATPSIKGVKPSALSEGIKQSTPELPGKGIPGGKIVNSALKAFGETGSFISKVAAPLAVPLTVLSNNEIGRAHV